ESTNWSQVGGDDLPIMTFKRNEEAGSQTAMNKLVMKNLPMMEAPSDYVRGEMGDLIEAVAAYDDSPSAIGYTMYYYANDMSMADDLKILAVDGVVPAGDTIRSGDYPFLNNYYVVCAEHPTEATQVLYDWILSDEGQKLVAREGYVPVTAAETAK
ncbi:substrate-binding domain-containing protein, partial [Oscillibacter sp.]|uniref:substrate-binding domain-containing protein n=1 Tax=Oscillibacter sp. TaxID=1945593 RepID=UPI0037C80E94